jgi:hypothetical protein
MFTSERTTVEKKDIGKYVKVRLLTMHEEHRGKYFKLLEYISEDMVKVDWNGNIYYFYESELQLVSQNIVPPGLLEKIKGDLVDFMILTSTNFVRHDFNNYYNFSCIHPDGTKFSSTPSDKKTSEHIHKVQLLKAIREHDERKLEKINEKK